MDHPGKSSHCVVFTDVRLIQNGTQQSPKQLDTVHHVSTAKIVVVASVPNGLSFSTHTTVILTNVIWEKLKHLLWNSASLEEKTKEAVTFNVKSPFLYFFFLYCPDSKWRAHWNLPKTCIPRTCHLCIWLADFHWTTHVFQPAHRSRIQHTEQSAFSVTNLPSRSRHHRGKAHKQAPGSSKTLQTSWSRGNLTYTIVWHCLIKNPLLLPAPIVPITSHS